MKQANNHEKFSENFKQIPKSFIREILNVAGSDKMISFAGGLPNPDYFPIEALKHSAGVVFQNNGVEMLQYAGSRGYLPLRQWIANRYNKKYQLSIQAENIIITNGSQQAIDVIGKMFVNCGDDVLVEKPTYLGGIQALSAYRPRFLETCLNSDGPDIVETGRIFEENDVKLMYAIPNFQNPSGITYSEEKRIKLASLLNNHKVLMLEDDPYNEICFDQKCAKPVYAYASEQVFWTGSFSKMVAPGLRMGWVVIPDGLSAYFERAKQSVDLQSNNLSQHIIYHFLVNNDIDQHLKTIRNAYARQCALMQQLIERYMPHNVHYTKPRGGMFLWLKLPYKIDAYELVERTMKQNVVFVPGSSFFVSANGQSNIRMNFSNASDDKMEEGIRIMASELKTMIHQTEESLHLKTM